MEKLNFLRLNLFKKASNTLKSCCAGKVRLFTRDCSVKQKMQRSGFLLPLLRVVPDCFLGYFLPRPLPCSLNSNIPVSPKHVHTYVSFLLLGVHPTRPASRLSRCSSVSPLPRQSPEDPRAPSAEESPESSELTAAQFRVLTCAASRTVKFHLRSSS